MPSRPALRGPRLPRRAFVLSLTAWCVCAAASAVWADAYDPPVGYYPANPALATIKQTLNDIIDAHDVISYDTARSALQNSDAGPPPQSNPNGRTIITVYDRTVLDVTNFNTSGIPGWNPSIWNREHTWPQSRGTSGGSGHSDLFNIRPSLVSGNSDRENLNYGGAYGANNGIPAQVVDNGATYYYPGNVEAGVVARQAFYMDTRYDGTDGNPNLTLVNGNPAANSSNQMGNLARLLEWHYEVVPNDFERKRNQLIYADGVAAQDWDQENRNPFIDRPEYVWPVFVDLANDSSLSLQGGTAIPGVPGGTALTVDLGRQLKGTVLPAWQSVTLNKAGVDGTYYSVTADANATSSVNGRYNAFRMESTGTKSITVGLAAATDMATAGLRTGTVTVDNLDVTGGGGATSGANDGNDVITASLRVLDHANASFAAASDVNTLNYNFGTVAMGAPAPTFGFDVFNLSGLANFTAGLDLDSFAANVPTMAFSTNLATFSGASTLAAGSSRAFQASFDTSTAGSFSVTYTLNFSDENLVGATSLGSLALTLTGTVAASAVSSADFDGDNDVDGDDFLRWQGKLGLSGTATRADGDANNDHNVDGLDLDVWQMQFGTTPPIAAAVPEPATWLCAAAGLAALEHRRRGRRRSD